MLPFKDQVLPTCRGRPEILLFTDGPPGHVILTPYHSSAFAYRDRGSRPVATSPLVLRWMCDSTRTGCAQRTTPYICGVNKQ